MQNRIKGNTYVTAAITATRNLGTGKMSNGKKRNKPYDSDVEER